MTLEELRTVIGAAVLAPSVHNTQPWRFALNEDSVDVFTDPDRGLPVIDSAGRELHLSCGAAIEYARLAGRSLGRACHVTLFPDGAEPAHVARIALGEPAPPTADEARLVDAIPLRYTDRGPFDARPVPPALVDDLRRVVTDLGVWVQSLDHPDQLVTLAVLSARADDVERANPAYRRELSTWRRVRSDAVDGIPDAALPVDRPVSDLRLREFDLTDEPEPHVPPLDAAPPEPERSLVLVVGTDGDDGWAWVQAGQGLARLLLRAAADGVTASPMTQVLEVPSTRVQLARELRCTGYPQVLLRMGYGRGRPATRRRPVASVVDGPTP